jgi:hypothetical protein
VRLTTVTRAVGLRLARDLPAAHGRVPLLARGAVVTHGYARALACHGIHAVWVDDELSAGIEPIELLPEATRAGAAAHVRTALESARSAFAAKQPLGHGALADLARVSRASRAASPTRRRRRSSWRTSPRPTSTRTATRSTSPRSGC